MDIISDIRGSKEEIGKCIERYGSVREHNFWFFYNQQRAYAKAFFFKFENDFGIMAMRYNSRLWEIIGDVLAPKRKRLEFFKQFLNYALFTKEDKKLFVCVPETFYSDILSIVEKSGKYKITNLPIIYHTPVFNVKNWDKSLKGGEFKKLRNVQNRFFKSHNVEVVPSKELDKKKLIDVVLQWRKYRPKTSQTFYLQMYINLIKNHFEGTDMARTILVNGEPCCITAGWSIPNSNDYYSAIGLCNYKYEGLAEVANIDDLNEIKEKGYGYADFGDSHKSLLQFKNKFKPEYCYQTYWFFIVKK